jgi:hypothetical protein
MSRLTKAERSAMFTEYNKLRGRGNVERGRLNRALGLVQAGAERPYRTTLKACSCDDHRHNGGVCKHMAALRIRQQMRKEAKVAAQLKTEAKCANCGQHIKARNNKAFRAITEYWRRGKRDLLCDGCRKGRDNAQSN